MTRSPGTQAATGLWRYAVLLVLCLVFYLPGQFVLPPVDRDEARFAQASRQMLESDDYVNIRFQNEARHKKPVGIYWLQSASVALFSPDDVTAIWAYRVPSWVGAMVAVLLTAWAGTSLFGPEAGLLAATMLAGTVLLGVEARMAKTDAVLLAATVAAQGALARFYLDRDGARGGWATALAFWLAQGVGILVKGPIVPMVSALTVATLWLIDRRIGWIRHLRPLAGLGIVVAIAAPWLILIAIATKGAFFVEAVGHDMLGKVASGQEAHGQPPGFYLLSFWLTFAPFAFLAVLAAPWVWANRREPAVRFCLAWIVPTWIVFELVPTKLFHYTLPTFPAIAALVAAAVVAGAAGAGRGGGHRLWIGALIPAGLFAIGLPIAVAALPWVVERRIDWVPMLAAPVIIAGFLAGMWLVRRDRTWAGVVATLAAAFLLYGVTYQRVFPELDQVWLSRQVALAVRSAKPCDDTILATAGYTEPSLVFMVGTETRLFGGGDSAARHLLANPSCGLALVESRQEDSFQRILTRTGRQTISLAAMAGFNYSRGGRQALTLYALQPQEGVRP